MVRPGSCDQELGCGITPTKPHGLRVGVPQRKFKVQFPEEGRTAGQIKAHHLYKHHLECRDKASKSVPSGWLRQGEHEAFKDKKEVLFHWKEQERNDGKWGGIRVNFVDLTNHV